MEQSLAENSRELELIERELLEVEVRTWQLIVYMTSCDLSYFKPRQPHMLNIQASIDARSTEMAKIQTKINKVEDEVCPPLNVTSAWLYFIVTLLNVSQVSVSTKCLVL